MKLTRIDKVLSRNGKGEQARDTAVAVDRVAEQDVAGLIGERFETIQDSLDQLSEMAQRFGTFESLLTQLREPLDAEFKSRRDNHIELVNLRNANASAMKQIGALNAEVRKLSDALAESETKADDLAARGGEATANLQEAKADLGRLRNELSHAATRLEGLEMAERTATQRIRELEQDQESLRNQLKQTEAGRADSDKGRIQAQRDLALALEENTALRRRVDEVGAEVAGLARAAAAGEGQLATERARAASEQAEAARAIRSLETQVEAARAEIAALTARLDTATARANGLEVLNSEQASRLNELQTGAHAAERKADTLQVSLDRALERVRALEIETEESRQRQASMEVARVAAVDRAEALTKAAMAHDKAIARAEERTAKLQAKLSAAQDEHEAKIQTLTQQINALREDLESARAESAMSAAALDAARRGRGGRATIAEAAAQLQAIVG
jgi:crescentin